MKVLDLTPGMQFKDVSRGNGLNTFIARCPHPYYPGLDLVIWRLCDGELSLDALSPMQELGECVPAKANPLGNRAAAHHGSQAWRENLRRAIGIGAE